MCCGLVDGSVCRLAELLTVLVTMADLMRARCRDSAVWRQVIVGGGLLAGVTEDCLQPTPLNLQGLRNTKSCMLYASVGLQAS